MQIQQSNQKTYFEVHRVLKNGSFFFKVWGTKTLGYKSGKIEKYTYNKIKFGPCKNMGISFLNIVN